MRFEGIIPALVTPYDAGNKVSDEMLRRLVGCHLKIGVNGLYLCGATGEGVLLSIEERKHITEVVINEVRGRLPVIVHVGAISTADAAELASHAERTGADAIASVPPFFYGVSAETILQHYAGIVERCRLPLLLYNIPSLTGVTVTPKMMARLMEIPNVVGLKFSSNDLYQMRQMLELEGGRLNVLFGQDEMFLPALIMGAHGSVGLTLNFMPKLFLEIFCNFRAGKIEEAQKTQFLVNQIISVLMEFSAIPAAKEILRFKGYDCGPARSPLQVLTSEQKTRLRSALEALGFFNLEVGI